MMYLSQDFSFYYVFLWCNKGRHCFNLKMSLLGDSLRKWFPNSSWKLLLVIQRAQKCVPVIWESIFRHRPSCPGVERPAEGARAFLGAGLGSLDCYHLFAAWWLTSPLNEKVLAQQNRYQMERESSHTVTQQCSKYLPYLMTRKFLDN